MAKNFCQWNDNNWAQEPRKDNTTHYHNNRNEGRIRNDFRNVNIFKESFNVPNESIGRIIGRGGCNIRNLQQEFNVRINLVANNVQVSGKSKSNICDAINKIKRYSTQIPTHNVHGADYGSVAPLTNDLLSVDVSNCDYGIEQHRHSNDTDDDCLLENGLINWDAIKKKSSEFEKKMWEGLPPLEKNFYKEDPEVANMDPKEVESLRDRNNNITVERIFVEKSETGSEKPIPNPIWKFEHCFADYPEIMAAINKHGFNKPSPIQAQGWPILLQGNNMVGIAQTGSGKTLAFLLPALIHIVRQPTPRSQRQGPNVLIVAPTRELALQIEKEVNKYPFMDVKAVCIYGGGSRQDQIESVKKGVDIIICTPGRLNDLCDAKIINVKYITYIVLDEADRMLDMGFEPQIRRFMLDIRPDRQAVMISATWPTNVRHLASTYLKSAIQVCVGTLDLAATHTVQQLLEFVEEDEKFQKITELVNNMKNTDKIIIFCSKKSRADDLSCDFNIRNIKSQCLHGSRDQWDREQAIGDITSGAVRILVATDLASRGLDIDDITHVINYDFPRNVEEYVHRVGRTGRAGRSGTSISYITSKDKGIASHLIKILKETKQEVPTQLVKMAEDFNNMRRSRGGYRMGINRSRDHREKGGKPYQSVWDLY